MDDINFEELDKAVNSARKKPDNPPSYMAETVEEPSIDESLTSQLPESIGSVERPLVAKRRGQFMDMVHPSSDMTTATPSSKRAVSPSRPRSTLQPLDASVVEATSPPEIATLVDEDTTPPDTQFEPVIPEDLSTSTEVRQGEWPDPLDGMNDTEQSFEDAQLAPITDYPSEQVTHVESDFASDEEGDLDNSKNEDVPSEQEEMTQTSPFIDGPEVEKRPLGAFTGTTNENIAIAEPENAEEDTSELLAPSIVSEELGSGVGLVESVEVSTTQETVPDHSTNQESMNASIPQQYKPSDDSLDNDQQEGHPVFDTKEYHQPLIPPAQKSRGGRVIRSILAVLLIVAFGVATGYIIWMFKLL